MEKEAIFSYPYSLEPSGNGREYHFCPKCGHKKFVPYICNKTGEYVNELSVGRCERRNNCKYHLTPGTYFNNANNNQIKKSKKMENLENKPTISRIPQERIDNNSLLDTNYKNTGLFYFMKKCFGKGEAEKAFDLYLILISKHYTKDMLYGVAYIQKDINDEIRQVKIMLYNPKTGKRVKEWDDFYYWDSRIRGYVKSKSGTPTIMHLGKKLMYDYEFKNELTFFGAHLIKSAPEKAIAIVESEKSAVICSICMPDYIWLATGGIYGCKWYSPEVYEILKGRKIILFPDLGATEDWKIKAESMRMVGLDISVYEDLERASYVTDEDRENGLDIADFLIRARQEENPELMLEGESEVKSIKAEVPVLNNLLNTLSLVKNTNEKSDNSDMLMSDDATADIQ